MSILSKTSAKGVVTLYKPCPRVAVDNRPSAPGAVTSLVPNVNRNVSIEKVKNHGVK